MAVSMGFRSSRWMFSMRVISSRRSSGIPGPTTGTCAESRKLGGAPAAFTGHQLVAVAALADYQRLDDSVGADGLRQFRKLSVLEDPPRLQGIGIDEIDGDVAGWFDAGAGAATGSGGWVRTRRKERAEALTEYAARVVGFVHGPESPLPVDVAFRAPERGS